MTFDDASTWLKPCGDSFIVDTELIQRFLLWIYDNAKDGRILPDKSEFTTNLWDTALKASQSFLNEQLTAKNLPKSETGFVRRLPGIDICCTQMVKRHQQSENSGEVDIQENLNGLMSVEKMLEGMRQLYSFAADTAAINLNAFQRISFISAFRRSLACANRNEDLRYDQLASLFTCRLGTIGLE